MLRRALLVALATSAAACGNNGSNPFAATSPSRPPAASAAIVFVSGSWTPEPGKSREVMAVAADGSGLQQLTTCARETPPCDVLQVAPSPDRSRIVAVRTTPDAEAGANALYFMDLSRSVQQIIVSKRRVQSADWSADGSFLLYSTVNPQTQNEDLFTSNPDGTNEQNLTDSLDVRERSARIDPFARTAAFEQFDTAGVSRIYLFRSTQVTSGTATGELLPGTPYVVGADATPSFSPDSSTLVFRRLTGVGNGGLGTWDLMTIPVATGSTPATVASGPLYRSAADWSSAGILYVETNAAAGTSELVLIQPDGSGRKVLRSEAAGYRMDGPRWLH